MQYKNIADASEEALKQMEEAYANYKDEVHGQHLPLRHSYEPCYEYVRLFTMTTTLCDVYYR